MGKINTQKTEWDFTLLFKSDDDSQMSEDRKEIEKISDDFVKKWKGRDDYLKDPSLLKEALDEYNNWFSSLGYDGKEGYYFWLKENVFGEDSGVKARFNKIQEFGQKISNKILFFELALSKIEKAKQEEFLKDEKLNNYKHFLEKVFKSAQYLLSEPEEKILTLKMGPAHGNWKRMIESFISKEEREIEIENGKKDKKSFSEILSLISHKDKKIRDKAAEAVNDILQKRSESAEFEINSILENKKIDDELRGMPRPDSSRHVSDDMDSEVVDSIIAAVSERYDISKRYYELKAKLFGVEKLKYHERTVPYGNMDKKYSFDESVELVYKVFSDLDADFAGIFKNFIEQGRVDVYPKKGKRGGAFCAYNLVSHPTFMMLNHSGKLHDVLTLAHESGHGINDEMMRKKQNALNFGTPLSTAEVASTFMEDFVLEELLKEADEKTRLAILMNKLDDSVSSIQRQVACYKFEQELHKTFREKGYLSKEEIGNIFQNNMFAYMGEFVEKSEGSQNWWVYWGHIRTFFYVYSYASGLLISKFMQSEVKKDRKFIEKVKEFLSTGLSDSPKNIFKKLGIDITKKEFWEEGLEGIDGLLTETEALAKKLGKI